MPQYVTLPTPNKNWWEPAANQAGNFLWQLALTKIAHNMRMEEQDRQLEAKKIQAKAETSKELALKGFEPVGAENPPGTVKVDDQLYKKPTAETFYVELDSGEKIPVVHKGGTLLQIKPPAAEKTGAQPSAFIQKYLVAKSEGFKGNITEYETYLAQQRAQALSRVAQQTLKEPNAQIKYRYYKDQESGKDMVQEMVFNPKTQAVEPAKDAKGNVVPPYEKPKGFNLMEQLLTGGTNQGPDKLSTLNAEIERLQRALQGIEE